MEYLEERNKLIKPPAQNKLNCQEILDNWANTLIYWIHYPIIMKGANEIILYQSDETLKLDVRAENETVWLTQTQIADLFGTKRPAITKHLTNIYKSGELEEGSTCSILEHMSQGGAR